MVNNRNDWGRKLEALESSPFDGWPASRRMILHLVIFQYRGGRLYRHLELYGGNLWITYEFWLVLLHHCYYGQCWMFECFCECASALAEMTFRESGWLLNRDSELLMGQKIAPAQENQFLLTCLQGLEVGKAESYHRTFWSQRFGNGI